MAVYWDLPVRSSEYSIVNKRVKWRYFREYPCPETLLDFGEIWWANIHFGDPRHFVRKRILEKGFKPVDLLKQLLELAETGPSAINADVPGMGPATLTEVLEVINPSEHATLNSKSRKCLQNVGYIPPDKNPDEESYRQFVEDVKDPVPKYGLRSEVEQNGRGMNGPYAMRRNASMSPSVSS